MRGFIAILFTVLLSTVFGKTPPAKGKLFIIGGGERTDALIDRMILESGLREGGYAIVLPMSSAEPDSSVYYAIKPFTKQGFKSIYGLHFVKGEVLTQQKLDSIRNAKLIFISGGDQNKFMDVVLGTEIEKAIHAAYQSGSMVAGTSAGAAVMSKVMITGNELKHPAYTATFQNIEEANIETKQGLGLLETVIIDQHFVKRSRHNRLISAIIEFPDMQGIGIDESTAILVKGKDVEVVGESQVIILENPKRSKVVRNGKLGASGIQMTVLLPGDKFRLK